MPAKRTPTGFHVYCDESSTTGHRFMVYGGVITAVENLPSLERSIAEWRTAHKLHGELKWTKVSNGKYEEYKSLVNWFFDRVRSRTLHFRAMVVKKSDPNYRAFVRDNKETGFYKFYYWFLLTNFAFYPRKHDCQMRVFIDERKVKANPLLVLQIVLNHGIRKHWAVPRDLVKTVEPINSKKSQLLQVADVIMGAVASHNNANHLRPDASRAKTDLANYIAFKAGIRNLRRDTAYTRGNFRVLRWSYKPNQRRRPSP